MAWTNIGAVHQALGKVDEALDAYERALVHQRRIGLKEDLGLLNNIGSLLVIMHREKEGMDYLERVVNIDPTFKNALINLGSHYQDMGKLLESEKNFRRVIISERELAEMDSAISTKSVNSSVMLEIRIAIMLSPICVDALSMTRERRRIENNLMHLLRRPKKDIYMTDLDASLDRTHFYIQYHGMNDRFVQEMVTEVSLPPSTPPTRHSNIKFSKCLWPPLSPK